MFMSPEQARGLRTIDHRTDLYSLGLVTYMMFTGNMAFNGDTLGELLLQICTQPLPSLLAGARWLPPAMEAWFQKACAREPDQRFPTAQAFIESMRIAGGLSAGLEHSGSYVPMVPSAPGSAPGMTPVGRPPGPMDLRPPPTMSDATVPNRAQIVPATTPSTNSALAFDGTITATPPGRGRTVAFVAAGAVALVLVGVGVAFVTHRHDTASQAAASPVTTSPVVPTVSAPVATLAPTAPAVAPSDSASAAVPSSPPSSTVTVAPTRLPSGPTPPRPGPTAAPKPTPAKPGNVDLGY
jgi:serine/threonine-protein kinase